MDHPRSRLPSPIRGGAGQKNKIASRDGAGIFYFSRLRVSRGGDVEKAKRGRWAGLRPGRARSMSDRMGLSGGGLKLPTDLRLRLRGDRGGGRALRAVKSGNRPRPAFSLAFTDGPLWHPRAVTEQCSFSSSAPFATRPSFRLVATRSFAAAAAGKPAIGRRKQPRRRRPGGSPTSPSATLSV